jgi:hypothetical protein
VLARSLVRAAPRGGTRAASEQKDDGQEDDLEQNTHEAIGDKSATEVDHVREGLEEPLLGIARNQGAGFMAPDRQTVAGQERTGLRIAGRGDPGEDVVAAGDLVHHPILQPEHVRESAVDARSRRADTLQRRVDAVDHGCRSGGLRRGLAGRRPGGPHPLDLLHLPFEQRRAGR